MNEVIEALKAGDRETAFHLLRRHLTANPRDANAWLWMSEATTDPRQQRDALQRVLALAPDHPRAEALRRRLERLEATLSGATHSARAATSPPAEEADRAEAAPYSDTDTSPPPVATPSAPADTLSLEEEEEAWRPRRDEPAAPAPGGAARAFPAPEADDELDLERLLAGDNVPPPPPAAAPEAASVFEAAHKAAPAWPNSTPSVRDESLDDLRAMLGVGEATPAPSEAAPASPVLSPDTPAQRDARATPLPEGHRTEGIPLWVWAIMLLSLVLVVAFLFILFNMSRTGTG